MRGAYPLGDLSNASNDEPVLIRIAKPGSAISNNTSSTKPIGCGVGSLTGFLLGCGCLLVRRRNLR
jgi:hypothetical protein